MRVFVTAAIAACLAVSAHGATTYTWIFKVSDAESKLPVDGTQIKFQLEDGRTGYKSEMSCTTNGVGECTLVGEVSGGGFFSYSRANGSFTIAKDGYSSEYKAAGRQLDSTTREVTVLVDRKQKLAFKVLDTDGKPLEDVQIMAQDKGAEQTMCRTDASGACDVTLDGRPQLSFVARKDGFYLAHALLSKPTLMYKDLGETARAAAALAHITCAKKDQCDRIYSTAQIFMARQVDMKTQFSNDTMTETYNPVKHDEVAGRVTRSPAGKHGWDVGIELYCGKRPTANTLVGKVDVDAVERECRTRQIAAYNDFKAYVAQHTQ